jgi:lactoylglutathione lyase
MSPTLTENPQLTHVSVVAADVEESTKFYRDVLGAESIATPQLGTQADFDTEEYPDLQMLQIGDVQLHLWNDPAREIESIKFAHFGVHVDEFTDVYEQAKQRDIFATVGSDTAPPQVFEFNGTAQMYIHDPTGNLIEVDHPDIDALDQSAFKNIVHRETSGPDRHIYSDLITS